MLKCWWVTLSTGLWVRYTIMVFLWFCELNENAPTTPVFEDTWQSQGGHLLNEAKCLYTLLTVLKSFLISWNLYSFLWSHHLDVNLKLFLPKIISPIVYNRTVSWIVIECAMKEGIKILQKNLYHITLDYWGVSFKEF